MYSFPNVAATVNAIDNVLARFESTFTRTRQVSAQVHKHKSVHRLGPLSHEGVTEFFMFHAGSYRTRCYFISMEVHLKYECERDTATHRP